MGSPEDQPHRRKWEQQHTVTLTQPYLIGKFEVTQQQWQFFGEKKESKLLQGATLSYGWSHMVRGHSVLS